ncbi:heme-binding domain-containing protein [Tenacibaculum maritimum]|uniref:heme-binding domain-containing protein n=1 Tax=Tenacibaculum maritimum TaxID=107401 RepID=UPI0012E4C49D|nr:heme-binding domain-containing protein [Tenacibaculum maritimum]CAA0202865.1 conserved hypothetical protein [Tenacibaculum maritimum]
MALLKKALLLFFFILFIGIQFYTPYKVLKPTSTSLEYDIILNNQPPTEVSTLLKTACYDCHSYESKTYWYSEIAPVSWLVKKHIIAGREALNFSEWELYSFSKKLDLSGKIMFEVYDGKMPLQEYLRMHPTANLSKKQQNKITQWINSLVE